MNSRLPLQVVVIQPETAEGRAELARRVAQVHAEAVMYTLQRLDCPDRQKRELLQAVVETLRARNP